MELFSVGRHNGVAVVTFDDGKVNAISHAVVDEFTATWDAIEADDEVHAVVFSGRPGQFCAGFDLSTIMLGGTKRKELITRGWELVLRVLETPLPVVMACTGNAVAGGAALLLAGDVRLGSSGDFKIGFNERPYVPAGGGRRGGIPASCLSPRNDHGRSHGGSGPARRVAR